MSIHICVGLCDLRVAQSHTHDLSHAIYCIERAGVGANTRLTHEHQWGVRPHKYSLSASHPPQTPRRGRERENVQIRIRSANNWEDPDNLDPLCIHHIKSEQWKGRGEAGVLHFFHCCASKLHFSVWHLPDFDFSFFTSCLRLFSTVLSFFYIHDFFKYLVYLCGVRCVILVAQTDQTLTVSSCRQLSYTSI